MSSLLDECGWQRDAATFVHGLMHEVEASWTSVAIAACYSSGWEQSGPQGRDECMRASLISMLNQQLLQLQWMEQVAGRGQVHIAAL